MKRVSLTFIFVLIGIFFLTGCVHDWNKDVIVNGIYFDKIRQSSSGTIIGDLASNTDIEGYPCKEGWVYFYEDYKLQNFTNYKEIEIDGVTIPEDTWVELTQDGTLDLCAFPENIIVQDHLVYGSGGSKGAHTTFYTDSENKGKLKSFFSPEDAVIGGIPCNGGPFGKLFDIIKLHPDGSLKYCTLSKDTTINGERYNKGDIITLDENRRIINVD